MLSRKKRAEFAVDLCEIVAAGNKIDCTDEEHMGSKVFKFCGRNIQLFLGGDFKFLCAMK